jgi:hypothetical protein
MGMDDQVHASPSLGPFGPSVKYRPSIQSSLQQSRRARAAEESEEITPAPGRGQAQPRRRLARYTRLFQQLDPAKLLGRNIFCRQCSSGFSSGRGKWRRRQMRAWGCSIWVASLIYNLECRTYNVFVASFFC